MIKNMKIGNKEFPIGVKTYLMGILNVTPDSFSDGGKHNSFDQALKRAETMIEEGADLIDIGGESTRPGHTVISIEEEIDRVVPIIEAIKKNWDIPISIDTYKSKVADAACLAGADLINDIWGLKKDPAMASIAKKHEVAVCLMHNRSNPQYDNFLEDFIQDLKESITIAIEAGISQDKIMIDPGIGFAKDLEQNLQIMNHLSLMQQLDYPILLAASRKSMIGLTLNEPVENRLEGTIATSVIGVMKGCHFIRVHDVNENLRALKMTEAIIQS